MKIKLSDEKFRNQSLEKYRVKKAEALDPSALSELRGIGDKIRRNTAYQIPGSNPSDKEYEVVSFVHPDSGLRIYGSLVSYTDEGDARIEIGDGEYALVPQQKVLRIGQKEDKEALQSEIRTAISQAFSPNDSSYSDNDSRIKYMSVGYSTFNGMPTEYEIQAYVGQTHPSATINSLDYSMPGKVGVELHIAEEKEAALEDSLEARAEMDKAVGGEVQEVLDPADVVDEDSNIDKEAQYEDYSYYSPQNKVPQSLTKTVTKGLKNVYKKLTNQDTPNVAPADIARALINSSRKDYVEKCFQIFFENGGGKALSSNANTFNRETLLAASLPTVQRTEPNFYKQLTNFSVQKYQKPDLKNAPETPVTQDQTPGTPAVTKQNPIAKNYESPAMLRKNLEKYKENLHDAVPQDRIPKFDPEDPYGHFDEKRDWQFKPKTKTSAVKVKKVKVENKENPLGKNDGSGELEDMPNQKFGPRDCSHLIENDLPPAMATIFDSITVSNPSRRGTYTVANVSWDKKLTKNYNEKAVKNLIVTYIKARMGNSAQGWDFGIIGKIYILLLDIKKGKALIQFSSTQQGPAPTEMTE